MRKIARVVALAVCGLLLSAGARASEIRQAAAPGSVEAAVLAASAEMERAAQAVDADRLFSLVLDTDKGPIIQNGAFLATREEALSRVRTNMRGLSRLEYRWNRQYVTVLAPGVALLTAEGESTATTADGRTFTVPFAQTVVFVLKDGRWLVQHAHQSSPQAR